MSSIPIQVFENEIPVGPSEVEFGTRYVMVVLWRIIMKRGQDQLVGVKDRPVVNMNKGAIGIKCSLSSQSLTSRLSRPLLTSDVGCFRQKT